MTIRDVGDKQAVRHLVYNPVTGALTNATVTLTVTAPDGSTSTPSVTNTSTGQYDASFTLSSAGKWYWKWDVSGAVVEVDYGEVTAADPSPPSYVSLAELKAGRNKTDADTDDALNRACFAASRSIDSRCGRYFYLNKTASARVYRLRERTFCDADGQWLLVDDIGTTSGLVVEVGDGTTWTAVTDYEAGPENALVNHRPITWLLRPNSYWGTTSRSRVRVTARWGWPEVPEEVVQAALIQANRLYMRKDSPWGVTGSAEWGAIRLTKMDPDVEALVSPLAIVTM